MFDSEPYITVVITLLGISYPILLQVIARLDEKYKSDNITEALKDELEWVAFKISLIISLVLIILNSINPILNDSSRNSTNFYEIVSIILASNTILLVLSFFFFVRKTLIYFSTNKIIPYLESQIRKGSDELKKEQSFRILFDILIYSIKKGDTRISRGLSEFYYGLFKEFRDNSQEGPVVYPEIYYELIYKAIEELSIAKDHRNTLLEHRTSGGIWLLGEFQQNEISEITYTWLWRNLLLSVRYKQDEFVMNHWKNCHQYFTYSLKLIYEEYKNSEDPRQITNKKAVDKRINERKRFIEFHYALGALLLYKEMYMCIKRTFQFTQSQPPKFELLPEKMDDIFSSFVQINDNINHRYLWISEIYPFPEMEGVGGDDLVKRWLSSYLVLLFLRQYTIIPYLITMHPLIFPETPKNQLELRKLIDKLDFFEELLNEHLKNKRLLESLDLDFITDEWCKKNNKITPLNFISSFRMNLNEVYHQNNISQELAEVKVIKFFETSSEIIGLTFKKVFDLNNPQTILDNTSDSWFISGQKVLIDKSAFVQNPEIEHIDYDSFLATHITERIIDGLSQTFYFKKKKSFLLRPEIIFDAIIRLKLHSNFIIVNFGINLKYYMQNLNVNGLTTESYNNLKIISFDRSNYLARNSLFILTKEDILNINLLEIDQEIKMKYELNENFNTKRIYSSVLDMNKVSDELILEQLPKTEDEIRKSVLMSILLKLEYKWKKDINMIQIKEYYEFTNNGLPNQLNEVVSFNELFSN